MTLITIQKKNEVYFQIKGDLHVHQELSDYFTFEVPEAKFLKRNPRYKYWDGTIRLYSPGTGEIYCGLLNQLQEWAQQKAYKIEYLPNKYYGDVVEDNDFVTPPAVKGFMDKISSVKPRDYQYETVYRAIKNNRGLFLSPTGSGKSLMIYSLVRYYHARNNKILIIVFALVLLIVISFNVYRAETLSTFNDSSSAKNYTGIGLWTNITYLKIPP
jgi:hypothetical protein